MYNDDNLIMLIKTNDFWGFTFFIFLIENMFCFNHINHEGFEKFLFPAPKVLLDNFNFLNFPIFQRRLLTLLGKNEELSRHETKSGHNKLVYSKAFNIEAGRKNDGKDVQIKASFFSVLIFPVFFLLSSFEKTIGKRFSFSCF